jgi:hypothetical protein
LEPARRAIPYQLLNPDERDPHQRRGGGGLIIYDLGLKPGSCIDITVTAPGSIRSKGNLHPERTVLMLDIMEH